MKKYAVAFALLIALAMMASGCATVRSPVTGFAFTDTKAPEWSLAVATNAQKGDKVGKAMCTSILGLVATGDCSLEAAMKNGGITKVKHVDYASKGILGIYAEYNTVVYGE